MPILAEEDRREIQKLLSDSLGGEVAIQFFKGEGNGHAGAESLASQTRELFSELASLDGRIKVTDLSQDDAKTRGLEKGPSFTIEGKSKGKVRYLGAPAGGEFAAFLADLVDVSKGTTRLSEATRKALEGVTKPTHIRVFVTPT